MSGVLVARRAFGGAVQAERQPERPQFGVEVQYVEVDAVVTDSRGNFIDDLGPEDFEILEDGKRQSIANFTQVNLQPTPAPGGPAGTVEPDVSTTGLGHRVRRAAHEFIDRSLGPNDLAAVVHTSGPTDAGQECTGNRRLLLSAVDKFMGRKLRSATLEILEERQNQRGGPVAAREDHEINDPRDAERGFHARSTLDPLRELSEAMAHVRGRRKAIVYFGEGIDYNIHDVFGARQAGVILDQTRQAIAAATRANVAICAIDPRGLTQWADETIEVADPGTDRAPNFLQSSLTSELRLSQDSLRVLAEETGGLAVVNQNDLASGLRRIVQDNSQYYLLGYYPAEERRDGRYRKIEVRVKRPGARVRARKGYVAPRGRPQPATARLETATGSSEALNNLVQSPLSQTGIPLRATATAFGLATRTRRACRSLWRWASRDLV